MNAASDSDRHLLSYGGGRIAFLLKRTNRKTLAITVKPDGSVAVTAPSGTAVEVIAGRVKRRAAWIRRQQEYFAKFQPKLPPRRYASGETHRYLGRQYRLRVVDGPAETAKLRGKYIWVETERKSEAIQVRRLVEAWYVEHAKERFSRSLAECLTRFHGRLNSPKLRLRRMPKRWGSWTTRGVVYLNPELVLAPPSCIDYVVTHELCHLVHASHGREFHSLMQRVMPDWQPRKARLEEIAAETSVCATPDGQHER